MLVLLQVIILLLFGEGFVAVRVMDPGDYLSPSLWPGDIGEGLAIRVIDPSSRLGLRHRPRGCLLLRESFLP